MASLTREIAVLNNWMDLEWWLQAAEKTRTVDYKHSLSKVIWKTNNIPSRIWPWMSYKWMIIQHFLNPSPKGAGVWSRGVGWKIAARVQLQNLNQFPNQALPRLFTSQKAFCRNWCFQTVQLLAEANIFFLSNHLKDGNEILLRYINYMMCIYIYTYMYILCISIVYVLIYIYIFI